MSTSANPRRRYGRFGALLSAAAVALAVTHCVDDFDPASKLGEHIQVLAIQSSPAEIMPEEPVNLTGLVYLPADWPHPLDAVWLTCIPAVGESTQACLETIFAQFGEPMVVCEQSCAADPDPPGCMEACLLDQMLTLVCDPDIQQKGCLAGFGNQATYRIPAGSFPADGEEHTFYVFMMATALEDGLAGCFAIWSEQVLAGNPIGPTEDCTLSLKRVTLLPMDGEPVANPALQTLYVDGVALPDPPAAPTYILSGPEPENNRISLEAELDSATAQREDMDSMYMSWFSDCGDLDKSRTFGDQPFNTLKPARTGLCRIFVVVRDGNNGMGWIEHHLDLQFHN